MEFRAGRVSVSVSQMRATATVGRNVGQCGTSHCHNTTCLNGGACLDHGATFTSVFPLSIWKDKSANLIIYVNRTMFFLLMNKFGESQAANKHGV